MSLEFIARNARLHKLPFIYTMRYEWYGIELIQGYLTENTGRLLSIMLCNLSDKKFPLRSSELSSSMQKILLARVDAVNFSVTGVGFTDIV
jgi:hypothetical protein